MSSKSPMTLARYDIEKGIVTGLVAAPAGPGDFTLLPEDFERSRALCARVTTSTLFACLTARER